MNQPNYIKPEHHDHLKRRAFELIQEHGAVLVQCSACLIKVVIPPVAGSFNCSSCGAEIVVEKVAKRLGFIDRLLARGRSIIPYGRG